jgi:hypothetical protein
MALRSGQKRKLVRSDIDPDETATFLVATYEGCLSLAKMSQDVRVLRSVKANTALYLETLRAANGKRGTAV